MGKSSAAPSSCLKIIACGSNSTASDDDIDHHALATTTQTKASGDKRGWSFRKKSGRHRAVGNNVTSEATTFADKEIPQVISTDFQAPAKSTTLDEKPEPVDKVGDVSALKYDGESKTSVEVIASANDFSVTCEKPKVSQVMVASDSERNSTSSEADDAVVVLEHGSFDTSADLGVVTESTILKAESDHMAELKIFNSEGVSEDGSDASVKVDEPVAEPVAVIVQASVRGFLAQQEFLQLKNVITLQAVIRGHLVRRNAVETLHCIRGITKVQALVRAQSSKALDQNCRKSEGQFSTAKLLKNSFARQLLESTPKPKSVSIRCDSSSPNSAWGWLERWMSVTSEVLQKPEPSADLQNGNEVQPCYSEQMCEVSPMSLLDPIASKVIVDEMTKSSESEGNHGVDLVDSHSSLPILVEKQQSHHMGEKINEDVDFIKMNANASVISGSQVELASLPDEAVAEIQQPKISAKRSASEELNGEGKKLSWSSRKASNPAIPVTQSNLEGFTSAADPGISIIPSYQNTGTENPADTSLSLEETLGKTSEPGVVGVDMPSDPRNLVGGSECGTELSITSTLDSPDRCDLEIAQPEPEIKILETSIGVEDTKDEHDCETDGMSSNNIYDFPSETIQKEEVYGTTDGVSVGSVVAEVSPLAEQKSEMQATDEPMNITGVNPSIGDNTAVVERKEGIDEQDSCLEHVTEIQAEKLSPEASPKSHMTVTESQGTPSSQVSVKDKKSRIGKSGSNTKHTSRSAGKRSPANPNLDSAPRSSVEHLPKDHKSGKRRSSFGSTKSDNDQEPRDSSSHSSLPSYMQATKSAKAKAHSPRSSPDFHDKEVTSKKRQSLPGAGGRQVSPRIQRSTSEAAQGAKPNGSHPSNERKWQR